MEKTKISYCPRVLILVLIVFVSGTLIFAQEEGKSLVLQEMSWPDVRDYLKTSASYAPGDGLL